MRRALIIPAAGRGSRLRTDVPKLLVPVAGRPMVDLLLDLYHGHVSTVVVVVSPDSKAAVESHCQARGHSVIVAVQPQPTGMLDAILAASPLLPTSSIDRVWITWCDQVAIRSSTVARLDAIDRDCPAAPIVLPTAHRPNPYIHFERDQTGVITRVLQRREGDDMPELGESDAGLFSLSAEAFESLARFSERAASGRGTEERNFLPFIPWIAQSARVVTYACADPSEAVGINTPEELRAVERFLTGPGDA